MFVTQASGEIFQRSKDQFTMGKDTPQILVKKAIHIELLFSSVGYRIREQVVERKKESNISSLPGLRFQLHH